MYGHERGIPILIYHLLYDMLQEKEKLATKFRNLHQRKNHRIIHYDFGVNYIFYKKAYLFLNSNLKIA